MRVSGVIARHSSYVPYLRAALTPEAVDKYMSHVFEDRSGSVDDRVTRLVYARNLRRAGSSLV